MIWDTLWGEIVFRAGKSRETYKASAKYDLKSGRIAALRRYRRAARCATSDSERTMVTAATKEVLAVIVSFGGVENLERWTQRLGTLLQRYAAGNEIVTNIGSRLSPRNKSVG